MRLGEFWEAIDAHNKEKEADRRHAGELARGVALRLFNIQVSQQSRISDASVFWPMPWDDVRVDDELERLEAMTDEERAEEVKKFLEKVNW